MEHRRFIVILGLWVGAAHAATAGKKPHGETDARTTTAIMESQTVVDDKVVDLYFNKIRDIRASKKDSSPVSTVPAINSNDLRSQSTGGVIEVVRVGGDAANSEDGAIREVAVKETVANLNVGDVKKQINPAVTREDVIQALNSPAFKQQAIPASSKIQNAQDLSKIENGETLSIPQPVLQAIAVINSNTKTRLNEDRAPVPSVTSTPAEIKKELEPSLASAALDSNATPAAPADVSALTGEFMAAARDALNQPRGARDSASDNELYKMSPPTVAPILGQALKTLVANDAKSLPASADVSSLNKLVNNDAFQRFAQKSMPVEKLDQLNKSVVAASLLGQKKLSQGEFNLIAGAFKSGTSPDAFDSILNKASLASLKANVGGLSAIGGESVPVESEAWIEAAKYLSSKSGLKKLEAGRDLKVFTAGYQSLRNLIAQLKKFKSLGLLKLVRLPLGDPFKNLPVIAHQNAVRALEMTSRLRSIGSVNEIKEKDELKTFAQLKLQELQAASGSRGVLRVLQSSFEIPYVREIWRQHAKKDYQNLRSATATLLFAETFYVMPPKVNPVVELVTASLKYLETQQEIQKEKFKEVDSKEIPRVPAELIPSGDDGMENEAD